MLSKKIFTQQNRNIIAASISHREWDTWIRCPIYVYIELHNWTLFNIATANVDVNGFIAWQCYHFASYCFKRNFTVLVIYINAMQNTVSIIACIRFCIDFAQPFNFNGQVNSNDHGFLVQVFKVIHTII